MAPVMKEWIANLQGPHNTKAEASSIVIDGAANESPSRTFSATDNFTSALSN